MKRGSSQRAAAGSPLGRRRLLGAGGAAPAVPCPLALGGACTTGGAAPAGKPQGSVEAWTVWDGTREALMNQQIEDFQRLVPAVTVRHSLVQQAQMYDKYTSAIAGGTSPDSVMVHGRMLPAMADQGQLVALDAYVRRDGLKPAEVWYEPEWQGQLWRGKAYGLPLASGGGNFVLYYNRSHFQEAGLDPNAPPKTWTDLTGAAERLTQRGGGRLGYASGGLWTEYLSCDAGRLFNNDLTRVAWNGVEGVESAQYELDLERRLHGGRAGLAEALGGQTQVQAFASGKLSMLNNGVYFAFYELKQLAPDLPYGAAALPLQRLERAGQIAQLLRRRLGLQHPPGRPQSGRRLGVAEVRLRRRGQPQVLPRPGPADAGQAPQRAPRVQAGLALLRRPRGHPAQPGPGRGDAGLAGDPHRADPDGGRRRRRARWAPKDGLDGGAKQAQLLLDRFAAGSGK